MFIEQTKEIMFQKLDTAFLADLIWIGGQLLNSVISSVISDLWVTIFHSQILVSMLSLINPEIEQ